MRNDRWSYDAEIRDVLEGGAWEEGSGPILYFRNGRAYRYTSEGHMIFLGVSGSGKSRRGTIPMIKSFIRAGESFIAVDPKGECYDQTGAEAQEGYDVHVIDFRHIFESERWNPLAAPYELFISGDPVKKQVAIEMIDDLAHTIFPVDTHSDPFWPESARCLFVGAVHALMTIGKPGQISMAGVYHLVADGEEGTGSFNVLNELVSFLPPDSIAAMMLKGYTSSARDTRASTLAVFMSGMSIFSRSEGLVSMLGGDDLHINGLDGETPTAIYIIIPDESPIFDSITGVLCSQLMGHYVRLAQDRYRGRLPRRLNVCLEELGNIGKAISTLDHLMSAGRSRNIRCQLVLQSLSQLEAIYGQGKSSIIRANADVLVAFRTNQLDTLRELSEKCGEREVVTGGHVSREHLITESQLASMKTGQALVIVSGYVRFISWLPDFTEMFDCSGWKAPERRIRERGRNVKFLDLKGYVRRQKRKKLEAQRGEPSHIWHGSDSLAELEEEIDSLFKEEEET